MNKKLLDFRKEQYSDFITILNEKWAVKPVTYKKFEPLVKTIFYRFLSLGCLATVIGYRSKRNEYIEGVVEASYLSIIFTLKGLENPTCVLLRQSIELVLKHIYFSQHLVEYDWVKSRDGYREINFQYLLEYLRKTNEYNEFELGVDVCNELNSWFSEFSRHVHVQNRGYMKFNTIGKAYRIKDTNVRRLNQQTKMLWPLLIVLLIIYFPSKFLKSAPIEQSLIINAIPAQFKSQIAEYLVDK